MITNDTRTHRFILEASLQSIATRFVMQQGDRSALEVNKIEMLQNNSHLTTLLEENKS